MGVPVLHSTIKEDTFTLMQSTIKREVPTITSTEFTLVINALQTPQYNNRLGRAIIPLIRDILPNTRYNLSESIAYSNRRSRRFFNQQNITQRLDANHLRSIVAPSDVQETSQIINSPTINNTTYIPTDVNTADTTTGIPDYAERPHPQINIRSYSVDPFVGFQPSRNPRTPRHNNHNQLRRQRRDDIQREGELIQRRDDIQREGESRLISNSNNNNPSRRVVVNSAAGDEDSSYAIFDLISSITRNESRRVNHSSANRNNTTSSSAARNGASNSLLERMMIANDRNSIMHSRNYHDDSDDDDDGNVDFRFQEVRLPSGFVNAGDLDLESEGDDDAFEFFQRDLNGY